MKLGERQELFMELLPQLLIHLHEQGYRCRGGDLFRDPRLHGHKGKNTVLSFLRPFIRKANFSRAIQAGYRAYGSSTSNHKDKCAIDLNLFRDGKWLNRTEDHKELGAFWESLHPLCRWGGRFNDGNHYELHDKEWR